MITRKRIEDRIGEALSWMGPLTHDDYTEIKRLALLALDGERDRALGAAVRAMFCDENGDAWEEPMYPCDIESAITNYLRTEQP